MTKPLVEHWLGEPYVGKPLSVTAYTIDDDLIQAYIEKTGDAHPWYVTASPFGGPVAPATLLCTHHWLHQDDWYLPTRYGNLHTKQEWELYQPAMRGDRIVATRTVSDRYSKRGREIVVNDVAIHRADGPLLARGRAHQSFLPASSQRETAVARDRERPADRRITPADGPGLERFGPVTRVVDQAMCDRFSGTASNYHTDAAEARKLGFPDVVVQGALPICFLSELMTHRFGVGWYVGGRMQVNLVNVQWVNERVQAHGVIRELTPEGERWRAHCEIWTAKDDDAITIIGRASAAIAD